MNKIKITTIIIVLIFINIIFAQTDSSHFKKWSASIYGGLFVAGTTTTNIYNKSANAGFDISYNYTPYIAVYINNTYNFLGITNNPEYHSTTGLLESTMGVKFYADTVFFKLFIELGFGYYQKFNHYLDSHYDYWNNNDNLGVNFGLGADFKFNNYVSFIIKGKLHFTEVSLDQRFLSYFGLYSGIKYNF